MWWNSDAQTILTPALWIWSYSKVEVSVCINAVMSNLRSQFPSNGCKWFVVRVIWGFVLDMEQFQCLVRVMTRGQKFLFNDAVCSCNRPPQSMQLESPVKTWRSDASQLSAATFSKPHGRARGAASLSVPVCFCMCQMWLRLSAAGLFGWDEVCTAFARTDACIYC